MLDPAKDPDRYDAAKDVVRHRPDEPEPDRRDHLAWLYGLVSVFGFLGLVTFLLSLRG